MAKAPTKTKPKGRVVEASMTAGGGGAIGGGLDPRVMEDLLSAVTMKAYEDGITDPDKILKLKLDARKAFKAERKAAEKAAADRAAKAASE